MELLSNLGDGLSYVIGVIPILTIILGVTMGIIAGATPGLSPSMGVALLVPFTYAMTPTLAAHGVQSDILTSGGNKGQHRGHTSNR